MRKQVEAAAMGQFISGNSTASTRILVAMRRVQQSLQIEKAAQKQSFDDPLASDTTVHRKTGTNDLLENDLAIVMLKGLAYPC